MRPINAERNNIHAELASEQLFERYFLQYVIVVLVRAEMKLIFKMLWEIIDEKKRPIQQVSGNGKLVSSVSGVTSYLG